MLSAVLGLSGCTGTNTNTETKTEETTKTIDVKANEMVSQDIFAMDTYMTVSAYGSNGQEGIEKAAEEIERLDALLSTGDAESEISKINGKGGGALDDDTDYLIRRSMEISELTDGAFDIAIYPVMKAWGFTDENYRVPGKEELESLLKLADQKKVFYDGDDKTVSFEEPGMEIDLGGIAKGYTSSRIMDIYRECGITSGLVSLGGNVQVLGLKPDGSKWKIAIQNPTADQDYLGVLQLENKAVITSGGYERYFEEDGKTYHHIIDPTTGYPADSGLTSVTIVSADGTLADGLSTSLFIMGKEKACEFWRGQKENFDFILLDKEGTLWVTEGVADDFTSEAYPVEVVR